MTDKLAIQVSGERWLDAAAARGHEMYDPISAWAHTNWIIAIGIGIAFWILVYQIDDAPEWLGSIFASAVLTVFGLVMSYWLGGEEIFAMAAVIFSLMWVVIVCAWAWRGIELAWKAIVK